VKGKAKRCSPEKGTASKHLPCAQTPQRPRATLSAKAIASCTLPPRLSCRIQSIPPTTHTTFFSLSFHRTLHTHTHTAIMSSSQMQEIMEMPREFIKDGTQFINRCTYVVSLSLLLPPTLALTPLTLVYSEIQC
jgi:hypothetical protein